MEATPSRCSTSSLSPVKTPCHDRFLSRGMSSTRMFICGVNIIRNLNCRSPIHGHATIVVYLQPVTTVFPSLARIQIGIPSTAICTCRLLRQTRYFVIHHRPEWVDRRAEQSSTIDAAIPGLDMRGDQYYPPPSFNRGGAKRKCMGPTVIKTRGGVVKGTRILVPRMRIIGSSVKIHESRPDQFLRSLSGSIIRTIPISPLRPEAPSACVRSKVKSQFCITSTP
jgi:hypothetical protein